MFLMEQKTWKFYMSRRLQMSLIIWIRVLLLYSFKEILISNSSQFYSSALVFCQCLHLYRDISNRQQTHVFKSFDPESHSKPFFPNDINKCYIRYLHLYEHLYGQFVYIFIYRKQMCSEQKGETRVFLLELWGMGDMQHRKHASAGRVVERKEAGNILSFTTDRYNRI